MWYMVWLIGVSLSRGTALGEDTDDKYDEIFQKMMECYPATAAFAISAVKDGKLVFNKAYGKASIEDDIDISTSTRFSIGSITKQFTAYLTGKQVVDGYYSWKDKIGELFEKHNVAMSLEGYFRNAVATLEDALTHMTGIKQCEWLLTDDRPFTRGQWMTLMLSHFEEQKEMRSSFYYNNWFYTLIGYLIELVGRESFEKQVKDQIFDPLGMKESLFVSDPEFDELAAGDFAQPYKEGSDERTLYPIPRRALKYIGLHNPAGGIVSTTGDMAKYMIAVIDALTGKEEAVLNKTVLRNITQTKVLIGQQLGDPTVIIKPTFPESFVDLGYGYGHILGIYKGYKYMNHGGSTYGHYSYITFIPDLGIGVFSVISGDDYMLTDTFKMQKLMQIYTLDTLMGDVSWVNSSNACTFPSPWLEMPPTKVSSNNQTPVTGSQTVQTAANYVGNFTNPVYPVMEIRLEKSLLTFLMGNSNGTVVPTGTKSVLSVILNLPVDPLNLPDSQKRRANLTFKYGSDSKVRGLVFEMSLTSEKFEFAKNAALPNFPTDIRVHLINLVLFYVVW